MDRSKAKVNNLVLVLVLLLLFSAGSSDRIFELPISLVDGYGSQRIGFGGLGNELASDNPWKATMTHNLKGVPQDWKGTVTKQVWLDGKQFAFQCYKQGVLSEDFFNELKTAWDIDLNKRPFSETPIKCFVYVVFGKNNEGTPRCKVDVNNNLDFSDDAEYTPPLLVWNKLDSLATNFSAKVEYEAFRNGKVVILTAPLLIVRNENGSLMRNIAQHAEAEFNGVKLLISSQDYNSIDYEPASICKNDNRYELVNENEFIQVGSDYYQNLGVNIDRQVLRLKKVPKDTLIYSSQVGFFARPFSNKEFTTRQAITLNDYKGKFLYLEFWGSWCGPCIQELPNIKKAYATLDRSKIEFLGVANDKPESLREILKKQKIEWKQIIQEEESGIIDDYNVKGYPTSFLIDPSGKIVAKNLTGDKLVDTLSYYIRNR